MQQGWAGRHIVILNWRDLEHPQSGGAEVFAERIAQQLADGGARVTLLAAASDGLAPVTSRNGFTIRRAGGTFGVYPAALRWLALHRREVDAVVDCQNGIPFFSPLVVRRKTPVVQVIHHVHQRQFGLFFSPAAATVGRQLESRGARIVYGRRPSVSVSPSTRTEVREVLRLRGPRYLVPNGLDLPSAAALASRSEHPTIVCVGRLVPHKRLELLLEAIPKLAGQVPHLRVHLVGDGPDEARLHEIAGKCDLPPDVLVWHGRLPSAERDELLARAWLTVNPTHGEGWGIGVMEAAAFGVPALAFDVQGLRDSVLAGRTGWLIAEGSSLGDGIVAALEALSDPPVALRYRQNCLDWAAQFGWKRSAELLLSVLTAESLWRSRPRPERRRPDDAAAVISISGLNDDPRSGGVHPGLRATDLVFTTSQPGVYSALLYGADPAGAKQALRRNMQAAGLNAEPDVAIRAADPDEYLRAVTHGINRTY